MSAENSGTFQAHLDDEIAEPYTADKMPAPTPWNLVAGVALGISLLVGLLVTAFAWPSANIEPRDVPVAVAGPPEAVGQVEQQLAAAMPDGFDIEPVTDADQARSLIEDRDAYGAIVLDPSGQPQVLTASAGSPAVAQVLQTIAQEMGQEGAGPPPVAVEDVVPLPDDDPRGSGFSSAALPMVLGGLAAGVIMSFVVTGASRRVVGGLSAAAGAGLITALVVQPWLGILEGNYLVNAGVIALTIAAIAGTLAGLTALVGPAGIGLGALVMLTLGNPLSGVTSAPEMLPTGWGTLGQWLPAGAGGSLLRSTSFFDGAAAGGPLLVLTGWLVFGLLLTAIGRTVRPTNLVARIS